MASSALTVATCLALPIVFAWRIRVPVSNLKQAAESELRTAQTLHLRRRLQHAACGLAIAFSYDWLIPDAWTVIALLSTFCGLFLELHVLRHRYEGVNKMYLQAFGPLLRPDEVHALPGAFWFVLGVAGAVALFPKVVALQSILHLSLGDPLASLVGVTMGHRNRVLPAGKSLAGTFAAFLTCATTTFLLFHYGTWESSSPDNTHDFSRARNRSIVCSSTNRLHDVLNVHSGESDGCTTAGSRDDCDKTNLLILVSVLGGMSGAIGEFLPLRVDDNVSMPLVSGVLFLVLHHCVEVYIGNGA